MDIHKRLKDLNITLPPRPEPAANYVPVVQAGKTIYVSGQTPKDGNTLVYKGKLGDSLSVEDGYAAAKLCAVRLLSALSSVTEDLNRVEKIIKLTVFVNATAEFTEHPQVANGASDLMETVYAERGMHARSAIGVSSLPSGAAVEIDLVAKLYD